MERSVKWSVVRLVALLTLVPVVDSCALEQSPGTDADVFAGDANFLAPEGIIISNDRVFVANASFAYSGSELLYGAGFVTVLDATTGQVVNRIPLPFLNPQELGVAGNRLWVLCSGQTHWDSTREMVVSKSSGGLVAIDLDTADVATGPSLAVPIDSDEGALVGYPSGMYLAGNTAWLASGTTAAIFKVDLLNGEVTRGPHNPVMVGDIDTQNTTVIGEGPDGLIMVGLFNSDTVFLLDPETGEKLSSPWAETQVGSAGQIDGILDIVYSADRGKAWLLFGLANKVVSFDGDPGPGAGVEQVISGVATPNRIKLFDNELFVVNSTGNSISSVDLESGAISKVRAALPPNCNPWDIDVAVGTYAGVAGSFAWVTCLKLNSVVVVDLGTGESTEIR
jgi:hypothetical protein